MSKSLNLREIDLNLLVVFDALLREKSVTRAAEKVGLSQPAMSNALTRLRDLFSDPLLVRGPKGMEPTPKALRLSPSVHQILEAIETTITEKEVFDPKKDSYTFQLMATDIAGPVVGPPIALALEKEAPLCQLRAYRLDEGTPLHSLSDGRVDLVIGFNFDPKPGLYAKNLRKEGWVTIAREGHPRIGKKLTLDLFCELAHVYTSPFGQGKAIVDKALEKKNLTRRVVLTTPTFLSTPFIVAGSDIIATVPETAARFVQRFLPIHIYPCPLELESFPWGIAWHQRTHHSQPHRWFRKLIEDVISGIKY